MARTENFLRGDQFHVDQLNSAALSIATNLAVFIHPPGVHVRLASLNRLIAGLNLPGRMMLVAHHQAMAMRVQMTDVSSMYVSAPGR